MLVSIPWALAEGIETSSGVRAQRTKVGRICKGATAEDLSGPAAGCLGFARLNHVNH